MRLALFIASAVSLLVSCGGQDAATRMCLSENAQLEKLVAANDKASRRVAVVAYQACAHSCESTRDESACAAYRTVTTHLCKEGPETCKALCEDEVTGRKNETACALLK